MDILKRLAHSQTLNNEVGNYARIVAQMQIRDLQVSATNLFTEMIKLVPRAELEDQLLRTWRESLPVLTREMLEERAILFYQKCVLNTIEQERSTEDVIKELRADLKELLVENNELREANMALRNKLRRQK